MSSARKPPSIKKIFGMCVRLERTRQGLSQELLGQMVGRDQAYISQVESGKRTATLEFVGRIAAALNVKPADLLDETLGRKTP
jgi:transcriptional regulator with XRE-family HTH domain